MNRKDVIKLLDKEVGLAIINIPIVQLSKTGDLIKRRFADWIKDRIEKYDFVENTDYFIPVPKNVNGVVKRSDGLLVDKITGRVIPVDYIANISANLITKQ